MSHHVLILDDDYDLRTTLADMLHMVCDADCVKIADVPEMIAAADKVLDCDVAFIDVNLGNNKPSGIDAYHWLRDHGYSGRIVFLTGHARMQTVVDELDRSGSAQFVPKPASLRTLCGIVEGSPG